MKVLVDQNIYFRIIPLIKVVLPDAYHVRDLGLMNQLDIEIFQFARQNQFDVILSMDEDFFNILMEHGVPPKIIWLRTGNASTASLAGSIIRQWEAIRAFLDNPELECIEVYR